MRRSHKKKLENLTSIKNKEILIKKPKKYEYTFNVTDHLRALVGVDLTEIPGIDISTALKLISEIGTDITRWPTVKHFCAWLGLCPGTRISGGRRLSSHTSHSTNKAATILRMSASSLYRNNSVFGAHLRKMKARMGPVEAITATAHKMARTIYFMMLKKQSYIEAGCDYFDKINADKTLKFLRKRASSLGYKLEKIECLESIT